MEWAAETLVVEYSKGVKSDARLVVELATVGDMAATHGALRLLTVKT